MLMETKHILIVDDDQTILRLLEYSLKKLGSDYEIATAMDSVDALNQIEERKFDVIIADYLMPELTGIDLARAVRRISPSTQVVLMTAYGTKGLRDTTEFLGFDAYLDKPFSLEEIRHVVEQAVEMTRQKAKKPPTVDPNLRQVLNKQLQALRVNSNARCVLLLGSDGRPVQVVGQVNNLEISSLGTFVAANFLATVELGNMLGTGSVFKSSYHEGNDYNIYAYDVNSKFLLVVVFDPKYKPGVVWFYTKQMAATLAKLLKKPDPNLKASVPS
jgi:CheY-like chemotaxis protein/predicted regulator of Ras-like GTPase activity (Roadblock/LC7/MglB family)